MKSYALIGLGLFTASIIVGQLDKRETRADLRSADFRMELMRNETRAEMQTMLDETRAGRRAADLKMDRMRIETLVYIGFTLFVAILGIIIPFLTKSK